MTATTLRQTEVAPETYPDLPDGLSAAAAALEPAVLWQRIEGYIAWRFSPRGVVWIAEGPGDWAPPLAPATITTVEEWRGATWQETTLDASPLGGYVLKGCGPYRISGEVGDLDEVPAIVNEAVKRLAEYTAAFHFEHIDIRSENVPDVYQAEYGSPSWRARALQDSGAADLLRDYRRA